jgi:hypothetical protein
MKDMKNKHLNLLSMHAHEDEINMLFSEVGNMCIKVKGIFLYLKDLHEKYASPSLPDSHWSEEIKSNSSVINYK